VEEMAGRGEGLRNGFHDLTGVDDAKMIVGD
jgi:hypothetical protein